MRRLQKTSSVLLTLGAVLILSGCGFRPIYATPAGASAPLTQLVAVRSVAASETILPLVTNALKDRIALKEGQTPKYDLYVETKERAERLAVQIDATVTRYNYRLRARYTLINLETGKRTRGSAQAITSYNIVSSQYSTLYAERAAQEKAARLLAAEIERDLLLRFANETLGEDAPEEAAPFLLDPDNDTLIDDRREGDVPDPFSDQ
jgi:LPS-assembly lipoprotein